MTYNLFISHSWSYSENYNALLGLLNKAPNFTYLCHPPFPYGLIHKQYPPSS